MKTLIFFRHGKSDWNANYIGDHGRPVAKRGKKAAHAMGLFLRDSGQIPDSVVTSSAVRARSTVEIAAEAGSWVCPVRVTDLLYESSPEAVLGEIHKEPEEHQSLLLTGHEPVWSEMISRLVGNVSIRFPTAAMARIDFETETWGEIRFGHGTLIWLVAPKLMTGGDD